ncbi:MAG: hypothetical protein ABIV43_02265 [Candidatus Saccharimonadales bacterium]
MSEQLQTQMPQVDAEQAAHVAAHNQQTTGTGWPEADTSSVPELPLPTAEATQTVLPEAINPDRALARLGARLSNFANRRTTKQIAGEAVTSTHEYVGDKKEAAKATAKKVGNAALTSTVLGINSALESAGNVQTTISDKTASAKETVAYAKGAAREVINQKITTRRETRKNDRLNAKYGREAARAVRGREKSAAADEKAMLKDAYRTNHKFDMQKSSEHKAMIEDAYSENKAHDKNVDMYAKLFDKAERRDQKVANKSRRAETRAEIAEKTKKATRVAVGTVALTGAVAGYAAYKTGEAAYKGGRKTIEVAGDVGNVINVSVRRGQLAAAEATTNARINRLDKRQTKFAAKSTKAGNKIQKIVNS